VLQSEPKEQKCTHEFQVVSNKHKAIFKQHPLLVGPIKEKYTQYAYLKCRYMLAKGFRFEMTDQNDECFIVEPRKGGD